MAGIYIHIPFCASRCRYCAFYSTLQSDCRGRYTDCVCRELERRAPLVAGQPPYTVYFGGGTPSQLTLQQLEQILSKVKRITCGNETEVTIECNPDDLTSDFAAGLKELGFNRLSMGIQTFDDGILKTLGRRHTSAQAMKAVRHARAAGFENISIDLMYALPGQTEDIQRDDLEKAISLDVEHISSYCLSYEPGSALCRMKDNGLLAPATDELAAAMYGTMCHSLKAAGYLHYEISNFSKPGFHSRHNSSYWDGTTYLGAGPSAHSFNGRQRLWNPSSLNAYMEAVENGRDISEFEDLTPADRMNECVMLALRTAKGLSLSGFRNSFGQKEEARLLDDASPYLASGRLELDRDTLRIPERYWFVSDDIISSLFKSSS